MDSRCSLLRCAGGVGGSTVAFVRGYFPNSIHHYPPSFCVFVNAVRINMDAGVFHRLRQRPLKVLLAFTAFKDSISAERLCDVWEARLLKHNPALAIVKFPISDGGDGFLATVERVVRRANAEWTSRSQRVTGPLGEEVIGQFGLMRRPGEERVGIIEIAKISGLEMVPEVKRNVYNTTNHGVGEVLKQLHAEGVRRVVFGLGGTSTVDCGMSILYALPCFRFSFDDGRRPLYLAGRDLQHITGIQCTEEYPQWRDLRVTAACDVKNTLLGPHGAVCMFGPQKGLRASDFQAYERTMSTVARLAGSLRGIDDLATHMHTGAAGGVLVGLSAGFPLTNAVSGFELISQLGNLRSAIDTADVVFTGEGRYDAQTHLGKAVQNVRSLRSDAIVICGKNETNEERVIDLVSRFGLQASMHDTERSMNLLIDQLLGVPPTRL